MTRRVNVMLDDSIWQQFQTVPAGERSRLVNEALAREMKRRRRMTAMEAMAASRASLPPVKGRSEDWMRKERKSH